MFLYPTNFQLFQSLTEMLKTCAGDRRGPETKQRIYYFLTNKISARILTNLGVYHEQIIGYISNSCGFTSN